MWLILDALHLSSSNRTAVTFAICGSNAEANAAFRRKTSFVYGRPLSTKSIRSTLKPAYGMILREQRRYLRCPISIPVTILRRNMPDVCCHSFNISEGGMALNTFATLSESENVRVQFTLPGHQEPLIAESTVCWLRTGSLGVRFLSLEGKLERQEWLSRKQEETLSASILRQFQGPEGSSMTTLARTKQNKNDGRVERWSGRE